MMFTLGDPKTKQSIEAFKDSVSVQFTGQFGDGSGMDICGPQELTLLENLNGHIVPVNFGYIYALDIIV